LSASIRSIEDRDADRKTKPSDPSKKREGSGTRKIKTAQGLAHPACQGIFAWYSISFVKACLIIGLLAVSVIVQPVQKKQSTAAPKDNQQEGNQVPPPPVSPPPPTTPLNGQDAPQHDQSLATKKATDWHEAFAPPTWSNWALAAIAVGGILVAWWTLGIIKRQTKATEIAANAAKESTDALISGDRAWILVEKIGREYLVPVEVQTERQSYCFFYLGNSGKTAGRVIAWKAELHISDRMDRPTDVSAFDCSGETFNSYMMPPGEPYIQIAILKGGGGFITQQQLDEITKQKIKYLWLCGIVKYEDVFRPELIHETWLCYLYDTIRNRPEPRFSPAGPPEYNKQT
jgi:hypothetical protein